MRVQVADPTVSGTKFAREVAEFRALERDYRRRGWILARADFPEALVVVAARQLAPPAIVTGVLFNYTDYDAQPPSVTLVDPFTEEPFPAEHLPTRLLRSVAPELPAGVQLPPGAQLQTVAQPLMQDYGPGTIPFLCLPGVREYHDHPGHKGDHWELHRTSGAGRLVRILEIIDTYGVRPIQNYEMQLALRVTGLSQSAVPV
jgi:hypothetical protein